MSEFPNFNGIVTDRPGKTVGVSVITVYNRRAELDPERS